MRFTDKEAHPNELSPLNLAFIGSLNDAIVDEGDRRLHL